MKFYEKIIGLNKNAPSDELIITFSNNGFEFNRNIYLHADRGISLSGGENAVISFRVGDPINIYKDLDSGTLTFASNGKNLDFDFSDHSDFNGGAIYAYNWSLGSLYSPLNRIYSTNGTFTNLYSTNGYFTKLSSSGHLNIEVSSNYYLELKGGTAKMIFDQDTVNLSGHLVMGSSAINKNLTVHGNITATNLYGNTAFTDHANDWTILTKISGVTPQLSGIEGNKTYQVMISFDSSVGIFKPFNNAPAFVGLYNNMTAIYNTFPNRGYDLYEATTFSFIYLTYSSTRPAKYYILYIAADGSCFLRKWDGDDELGESWNLVDSDYTLFFRKIN